MGKAGWTSVDELQRLGFKQETEKFLVWFSFKDDGFSIESFIEKDFVWGKLPETRVSKNEAIVDVSNVFDKKVMVGKDLFEVDGPYLFTDGDDHETEGWG